jgi:galactitol-specific phosphotransferase system IIB component
MDNERQYAFWRGMMATLMQAGTYVVPVPGNHEVQMPTKTPEGVVKLAQPHLEKQWRDNMGDLILDVERWNQIVKKPITYWDINNTSTPEQDQVQTAQTQLNYSFDVGQIHFAVLNTDPVGADHTVNSSWLSRDFEQAKARGAVTFLAFGHKMPFTYFPEVGGKKEADGLDVRPMERDAFWSIIEKYGATYFCGHEHVYDASQPLKAQGGKSWQIIVGSGGSPFSVKKEDTRNPKDRMYAWADVMVRKNGALNVRILGFDEQMGPTKVISKWTIEP